MPLTPTQRAQALTQLRTKSLRRTTTRLFLSICENYSHREPLELPPPGPPILGKEPIDEENCPSYNSKKFYPAKPGEALANRYQILVKVGWGVSSTVWFARDMRGNRWEPENVVAFKIINTNLCTNEEREIEEHIAKANPSHRGHPFFRTFTECFEIGVSEEKHLCLAYELMREPI